MMARVAGTPTSTSAATDQTADIFDFDCIYSYDIQRKRQKRWQDGFLRFHAFNRRVMVYDVPRNFIGDTHLREADTLQDGDELQLDRGVLVEVCGCRGTSKQDVTPLFEKKRPQVPRNEANEAPTPRSTHSSPPLPSSLLKPKSLNIVLGPRRGLQGRAVLAKNSPYEHTKRAETVPQPYEPERPTKKPRLEQLSRAPPVPRRNTKERFEIRRASTLLPDIGPDRLPNSEQCMQQGKPKATREHQSPPPPRSRGKNNAVNIQAAPRDPTHDMAPIRIRESTPVHNKDRLTSKLKVSATKKPMLMCLQSSATKPKDSSRPERSEQRKSPQRRAPLRVSAMDQSSSPTSPNFTIMDFPTTQDIFAESTPVPPARTLDELDRELLRSPPPLPAHFPISEPEIMSNKAFQPPPPAALESTGNPPTLQPPASPGPEADPETVATSAPNPPAPADIKPADASAQASCKSAPLKPPPATATTAAAEPARPSVKPQIASPKKPSSKFTPVIQRPTADPPAKSVTSVSTAPSRANARTRTSTSTISTAKTTTPPPAAVPPEADIGPWSRTAFDLFGFEIPAKGAAVHEVRLLKQRATAIRGSVRGMMREYCD